MQKLVKTQEIVLIDTQRTENVQMAVLMSIILMSTLNILKHTILPKEEKEQTLELFSVIILNIFAQIFKELKTPIKDPSQQKFRYFSY